jgi:hypothetical protein
MFNRKAAKVEWWRDIAIGCHEKAILDRCILNKIAPLTTGQRHFQAALDGQFLFEQVLDETLTLHAAGCGDFLAGLWRLRSGGWRAAANAGRARGACGARQPDQHRHHKTD